MWIGDVCSITRETLLEELESSRRTFCVWTGRGGIGMSKPC